MKNFPAIVLGIFTPPHFKIFGFKLTLLCLFILKIVPLQSQVSSQCTDLNCNLVCFGDFEEFTPEFSTYHTQLGVSTFYVQGSTSTTNSVDIVNDVNRNSQVMRWINPLTAVGASNLEAPLIPLSVPIPDGCTAFIRLKAGAAVGSGFNPPLPDPTIGIWGLSAAPCAVITEPDCGVQQFQLCSSPNIQAYRLGCQSVPLDQGVTANGLDYSGLDLQTYTFTVSNNSGAAITHLLLYGESTATGAHGYQFFVDDVEVNADCVCNLTEPCVDCPGNPTQTYVVYPMFDGERKLTSTDIPYTGLISDACIVVFGRLVMDADLRLENSHVIMNEGAEIVTQSGTQLVLKNTTVEGCNFMWRGIQVNGGGLIDATGSRIRDAQYAIHAFNGASIRLTDNEFDRNYIGLRTPARGRPCSQSVSNAVFSGNDFLCTQNLKTAYAGQTPAPGTVTVAGVEVNNLGIMSIGPDNHFSGIANGVVATGSGLLFFDNTIDNLASHGGSILNADRCGVWAVNCCFADVNNNVMNGVGAGVRAFSSDVTVANNTIRGYGSDTPGYDDVGIAYENGNGRYINIADNQIETWDFGIKIDECPFPSYLAVRTSNSLPPGNTINILSSTGGIGVSMVNCSNGLVSAVTARNNATTSQGSGFSLTNCDAMDFSLNEAINFSVGFFLINCGNNRFSANNAYSFAANGFPASAFDNNVGFWVINSPENQYSCNYTADQDLDGWSFTGACNTSDWRCNDIGNAGTGLRLTNGSLFGATAISPQPFKGNNWFGSYGIMGAFHESGVPTTVLASQFRTLPLETPSWATGAGQSITWFESLLGESTPCDSICGNIIGGKDGFQVGGISGDESWVIEDTIDRAGTQWMMRQRLFDRMYRDSSIAQSSAVFQSFFQYHDNTAMGDLYRVRSRMDDMLREWTGQNAWRDSLQNQLFVLADSLGELYQTGPGANEAAWRQQIDTLIATLATLNNAYTALLDSASVFLSAAAADLAVENEAIQPANLPAENEKLLNALYLINQLWSLQTPSSGVLDSLRSVADQCPFEGGFAVHWARGLYSRFVSDAFWNDTTLCSVSERADLSEKKPARSGALVLTPNPVDDLLQIATNGFESEVLIQFLTPSGHIVWESAHPAGAHTTQKSVAHLPNGLYFYRVLHRGELTTSGKFVIQH